MRVDLLLVLINMEVYILVVVLILTLELILKVLIHHYQVSMICLSQKCQKVGVKFGQAILEAIMVMIFQISKLTSLTIYI